MGIALFSGCLGDPPPGPDIQPLEIIAGNNDSRYGPCLINVDEVAAGTHDVAPIALTGKARVRILDPSGAVIFERTVQEHLAESRKDELRREGQETVRLMAGEHRVECVVGGRTHSESLRVVPGRR